MKLAKIIFILLAITLLASCKEGQHSYFCDGRVTNGKEIEDADFKSYFKKTVKYEYTCWGTNTATRLIGGLLGINGCTIAVGEKKNIFGYISQHDTVVSMKPFTSFNPRTSQLEYSFRTQEDGVDESYIGACK